VSATSGDRALDADQLTMRLDAPLPNLPAGLRPMLARPLPEPFDSDAHLFEPMWGGARALALIGPAEVAGAGDVQLVAEDGTRGPAPLDLAGIAGRVAARSAVLDGEVVVVDEAGRLDH
jgi:bifunctional non-homologous end joining protein LigD